MGILLSVVTPIASHDRFSRLFSVSGKPCSRLCSTSPTLSSNVHEDDDD